MRQERVALQHWDKITSLLEERRLENLHLLGALTEGRSDLEGIWVDDPDEPQGILLQLRGWYRLYARTEEGALGLLETLHWSGGVNFGGLHRTFVRVLSRTYKVLSEGPCLLYALPGPVRCDRRHPVRPLRDRDAPLVTRHWRYGDDEEHIRHRIARGPGFGVEVGGNLVSWALTHADGSMGVLHTLEAHRGKGYARSVVAVLASAIQEQGRIPFGFIEDSNVHSERVVEALGFQRIGEYAWLTASLPTRVSPSGDTASLSGGIPFQQRDSET
ncbi:MAG: GNAT family N-acetyltransferase [candidate division NC10 bacterium]|nr:hypothetical protein [candidate division NC10 bacterium]MCH7896225.1 hypothetical protein [candidate division NC10 bacterium]MCZ6551674.1 GNAT family N-acetyltransferase [candidate division NC10 bacterium]